MRILTDHFTGLIIFCPHCNAMLGYTAADIIDNCFISCAKCHQKIEVPLHLEGEEK